MPELPGQEGHDDAGSAGVGTGVVMLESIHTGNLGHRGQLVVGHLDDAAGRCIAGQGEGTGER